MRFGVRLFLCVFFAFALVSSASARHSVSVSGNEMVFGIGGRSLKAIRVDDYSEPSANRGHDPRTGGGGGRRG